MKRLLTALLLALVVFPAFAAAAIWTPGQPLIPCKDDCDFDKLVQLVQNLITFLLWLSVPASILLFSWAGFLWMTAREDKGQIKKAMGIIRDVIVGVLIMGMAWLLVYTSLNTLLSEQYKARLTPLPQTR